MEDLQGKVVVVTGGASGIGLGMAKAFHAEGAKVVLADIEEPALKAAADGFPADDVLSVVTDVSRYDQVEALRDAAIERFGAVHVVCNNAGVSAGGPTWEHSLADWEWVLGVNLWGVIHGVKAFTPTFLAQGEGHVVNTASMAGLTSPPFMSIYNVSKHAVVTLSETMFGELQMSGGQVGVSVLCPGWVNTRIHEAGRNRPDAVEEPIADEGMRDMIAGVIASGLDPDDVGRMVAEAVKARRFYILTHPDWKPMISGRIERIVAEEDPVTGLLPT